MKVMRFSLVFSLELHVKDLVRVICDAWLICSEINLLGLTMSENFNFLFIVRNMSAYRFESKKLTKNNR